MATTNLIVDGQEEFTIEVDFDPETPDPARVFRAMSGLIESVHSIDRHLARSIGTDLDAVEFLKEVQSGSVRAVIRSQVGSAANRIRDLPENTVRFITAGRQRILDFVSVRDRVEDLDSVNELREGLSELAAASGVDANLNYQGLSNKQLMEDMENVSTAASELADADSAMLESDLGTVQINKHFRLDATEIQRLLTEEVVSTVSELVLTVKKPDYLGASRWEFRYNNRIIEAKVIDENWLADFQERRITLRPGDAIRAMTHYEMQYAGDGTLIAEHFTVKQVLGVIAAERTEQGDLL